MRRRSVDIGMIKAVNLLRQEAEAETRRWTKVTFADPARATEWIAQHRILAGHVQVLCAHRGQAALRLYLTEWQQRALPGRAARSPPDAPAETKT